MPPTPTLKERIEDILKSTNNVSLLANLVFFLILTDRKAVVEELIGAVDEKDTCVKLEDHGPETWCYTCKTCGGPAFGPHPDHQYSPICPAGQAGLGKCSVCGKEKCLEDCVLDMMVGFENHSKEACHGHEAEKGKCFYCAKKGVPRHSECKQFHCIECLCPKAEEPKCDGSGKLRPIIIGDSLHFDKCHGCPACSPKPEVCERCGKELCKAHPHDLKAIEACYRKEKCHGSCPPPATEVWEERFDKEFGEDFGYNWNERTAEYRFTNPKFKAFIRQVAAQAREDERKAAGERVVPVATKVLLEVEQRGFTRGVQASLEGVNNLNPHKGGLEIPYIQGMGYMQELAGRAIRSLLEKKG